MVFGVPLTMALTFLRLGFQVLLLLLWEWLTLIPKTMLLPQTSHFAIYRTPPINLKTIITLSQTLMCIAPYMSTYLISAKHAQTNQQTVLYQKNIINASIFYVFFKLFHRMVQKCRFYRIFHKHSDGHGTHTAGHRRNGRGFFAG